MWFYHIIMIGIQVIVSSLMQLIINKVKLSWKKKCLTTVSFNSHQRWKTKYIWVIFKKNDTKPIYTSAYLYLCVCVYDCNE